MKKLLIEKLGLCDSGKKVEEAGHSHYLAEFWRYANNDKVKFLPKGKTKDRKIKMETTKLISSLRSPYKELYDLVTKATMSHLGNVSTVTWPKLKILTALIDEVVKIEKYNWCQFMIDQLVDASKSVVPASDISFKVKMKKIRFAHLISYTLEKLLTQLKKVKEVDVKNTLVFRSQVDKPNWEPEKAVLLPEEVEEQPQSKEVEIGVDLPVVTKK